jgi:hypothetical protein
VRRQRTWPQAVAKFFSTDSLLITTGGRSKHMQRVRLNWRHPLALPALAGAAAVAVVYAAWLVIAAVRAMWRWFAA